MLLSRNYTRNPMNTTTIAKLAHNELAASLKKRQKKALEVGLTKRVMEKEDI